MKTAGDCPFISIEDLLLKQVNKCILWGKKCPSVSFYHHVFAKKNVGTFIEPVCGEPVILVITAFQSTCVHLSICGDLS